MYLIPTGTVTSNKEVQPLNAYESILSNAGGKMSDEIFVQPMKELYPINFKEDGSARAVNLSQFANAALRISSTVEGMEKEPVLYFGKKYKMVLEALYKTLSSATK